MIKKILLVLLLLALLATGFIFYTVHYLDTAIKTPSLFHIPKGSTKNIIKVFKKEGIDLHWFDYYLITMKGYPQAGWIELGEKVLTRDEFFEKITHAKAALQKVTLIPGETAPLFLEQLSNEFDLNLTKLYSYHDKYAPFKDGVILADTYSLPRGIDEEELMRYLITTSLTKHEKLSKQYLSHYDEKEWFNDIITKASIIQKESADSDEMPIVSAVIRNRLSKKMKLQMDGTLNYGRFSHVRVTAKKIREDNSAFNTYKHEGLPPYPICSVNKTAIEAAINPENVTYLYFVKGKSGKHIFTNSYKEHLKNIK